ncbi:MAG: NAD-dependent epimerase/dehydratase family protein [Candidatus Binatia bacterium]
MRIAVSGAGGFLGSRLAERLVVESHALRALVRPGMPQWLRKRGAKLLVGDTTERASQHALVAGCEIVFHAAGLVAEVAASESTSGRVNVAGTEGLAQAAIDAGARRIVFMSLTSVHAPAFFRNSRVVDHSRAWRDLGYDPAVGVREGVERTARWYEQAGWL